ncbi:chemotaxis protein CheW [Aliikangiella sp. IMCC44359]|uniref:chemotaxis protein CheW n=1 Tax=Aliikangiella sp. IMCC44359 TaxID=3459125 RepID=UPI00403AB81A
MQSHKQKANEVELFKKQFLTFCLGSEFFGLELHQTREILEYKGVTPVPLMPAFICGVINLRGDVVPIIDLALRLGRPPITLHRRTCIVVVEIEVDDNQVVLGLLADSVSEVIEMDGEKIEEAPAFGAKIKAEFILGIAQKNDDFIILLDADKALSPKELAYLIEAEFE